MTLTTVQPTVYAFRGVAHQYVSPARTSCGQLTNDGCGQRWGDFVPAAQITQLGLTPCPDKSCRTTEGR